MPTVGNYFCIYCGKVLKHKWELLFQAVPISSLVNCFTSGVRLRFYGWLHFKLLRACAFCCLVCNPSLSCLACYSIPLRLSLRFSLRSTFQDGASYRIQCGSSLAISTYAVWNISDFSAVLLPGIVEKTCVSSFSRSLTQPSNERLAFFRVEGTIRSLFSFNL